VKLASITSKIGHSFAEPEKGKEFFQSLLQNRARLGVEASICLDMDIVLMLLKLNDFKEAKVLLDSTKELLAGISSGETVMFSKYYESLSEYHKICGPASDFYKAGLMFLAYTSMEDLSTTRKYELATDMALAALAGENIYNFGEVIATPILATLKGTPNEWLQDLILSINSGNIDKFNLTVDTYKSQYFNQPALASQHETIKQKLVLLCLLNIVFERASHDRLIKFADIASRARIPVDQVEWVIMRAISLGLVKGSMDEVDQVVNIEWIQPRVLEKSQLEVLKTQVEHWSER
jgi:26S proteasome regulatory subunit N9